MCDRAICMITQDTINGIGRGRRVYVSVAWDWANIYNDVIIWHAYNVVEHSV